MKGKRYTTEKKIRILREADSDTSILEMCRGAHLRHSGLSLLNRIEQLGSIAHPSQSIRRQALLSKEGNRR